MGRPASDREQGDFLGLLRRRPPAYQLTGLVASPEGLYDGSFIVGCARWWSHQVESRSKLPRAGYSSFTSDDVRRLCAVPQPENRAALEGVSSAMSMPGRHSAAVLSLAYAFAVVIEAAAGQVLDDFPEAAWAQARPFTNGDLTELERHYSKEGAAREYDLWMPYWQLAGSLLAESVAREVIESLKATFDDQVDRWSAAEGFDLRRSIGAPDYALIAADEHAGLTNFVELLLEWGGRLRLGERLIAEGWDLKDLRFDRDEMNPIDHFYDQAYERYIELASQPNPPISDEIEYAVRACAAWLGEKRSAEQRLAISTTAVRGYLWRTVEDGPVDFLEPELSEAVTRSRTVGEDRSSEEPLGITLYFAATQCMVDNVKTRLGSVGGLIQGPRSYEKAFWDTTDDFEEHGIILDEETKRQAFQFGVCLADVERVLATRADVGDIPRAPE